MTQDDGTPVVATVGIAGWGRMGAGMGSFLLRRGWPVAAFDPSASAGKAIEADGAVRTSSAAALAQRSDLILVVVVDDDQVDAVLGGEDGVLAAARPGSVVAICASVHPETCRKQAQAGAALGVHVIDCALVGGERGAEAGALRLMCGGPDDVVDACRPAFAAFASDVCRIGEVGAGQVAKTANNILLWANIRADFEVLTLAREYGVHPGKLRTFLGAGSGANRPLAEWGQHRLRWPEKDLEVAIKMAGDVDLELPLVEVLQSLMASLTVEQLHDLK
jgi:3-hydroxyisobutyrate dehydrogenase-like beta-hydroxyacid dehydrogenase